MSDKETLRYQRWQPSIIRNAEEVTHILADCATLEEVTVISFFSSTYG